MKARIVLGSSLLARYRTGAGHWCAFLQYLAGLRELGHDVYWLELLEPIGVEFRDERRRRNFLTRMSQYGFADRTLLVMAPAEGDVDLDSIIPVNTTREAVAELAASADLFWNLAGSVPHPLPTRFKRTALIDTDPGLRQIYSLPPAELRGYAALFTVGMNIGKPGCPVPTRGRQWIPIRPVLHLPWWSFSAPPGVRAAWTSVTHWSWAGTLSYRGRQLSQSKRTAYLEHVDLPRRTRAKLKLAAYLGPDQGLGDRELLTTNGWSIVDPVRVAGTLAGYRRFIARSRGEILFPKEIFQALRTGWFSDRSACYLASGRPVVCGETGFSDCLPTGDGLRAFTTTAEAAAAIDEIERNYEHHARSARRLAEEEFDGSRTLRRMLDRC